MGSPAAKIFVSISLVANHRVQGVHHLVGQHAWNTQQGIPEKRGNHTVAQILGQRLEGCRAHLLGREFRSIASHDASHLFATFVQAPVKSKEHLSDLANQRGAR